MWLGVLIVAWSLGFHSGPALNGVAAPDQGSGSHSREADQAKRRAEVVFPKGRVVIAEIADSPESVQRGYMFRESVAAKEGMLFTFHRPGVHPMWMKNTRVPLDIIWMDADFDVIHIERSVPPCRKDPCPSYGPLRKVSFVLEVQGGSVADNQLAVGDRLSITFPRAHR